MDGGDWVDQPQQQVSWQECSTTREYYKQLREYKELPIKEKVDVSFQFLGIIWGYTWLVIIPLVIGAVFWREVFSLLKRYKLNVFVSKEG